MDAADRDFRGSRTELLLEHVSAFDAERSRPTAHERLERLVGGYLARLLVGALSARRPRTVDVD